MIAITIIVSSVSSSLALVQSSITASTIGGTHVVAANLAREGAEVARSVRDSNWLKGQSFQVGLTDAGGKAARPFLNTATGAWSFSFAPTSLSSPSSAVYLDRDGIYVQADGLPAGGTLSPYSRVVTLNHVCRDNGTGEERIVTSGSCLGTETLVALDAVSEVRWRAIGGAQQTVTVESRLYDWR
jgi:hypothetical protein